MEYCFSHPQDETKEGRTGFVVITIFWLILLIVFASLDAEPAAYWITNILCGFADLICIIVWIGAGQEAKEFEKEAEAYKEAMKKQIEKERIQSEKIAAANKQIIDCICDNIFKLTKRVKGYRNYDDKVVGTWYTNIRLQKTIDCYVKHVPCKSDKDAIGVFAMNDVRVGFLPADSLLKAKLARELKGEDRVEGYVALNCFENGRGKIKLRIPNSIMD